MNISNVLAGIMTKDHAAARTWYANLLGRTADATPMEGLAEWHFEGGVLQLVQDEERAGASSVALIVSSRDEVRTEVEVKGVPIGPTTETEFVKTLTINDPEGNRITFAENLG